MRFAWITDPHLNHVPASLRERWLESIRVQRCEAILISGDVAESHDLTLRLRDVAESLAIPVYFVLGNHDFYGSSIGATVAKVIHACREHEQVHYLTDLSPIPIGDERGKPIYLLGEDGWGDAAEGDYERSYVRLNDFQQIEDFAKSNHQDWKRQLGELGAESAERLRSKLDDLPDGAADVLIITHVPPFRDACWYEGHTTDDDWAPFFVCGQVGRVLRDFARQRRDCDFTVLCGHTHHGGVANIESNLTVYTGGATYGEPSIVGVINAAQRPLRPEPAIASGDT